MKPNNKLTLVPSQNSRLEIEIPYPFGKHILVVKSFQGNLSFDATNSVLEAGCISLNVSDFQTKDPILLCHFFEAMTLDYTVSDYPKKHVGNDNKLPLTGKNSPQYTSISATLNKPTKLKDLSLNLKWIIRGIKKSFETPVRCNWDQDEKKLTIIAEWKMNRSDFDIVVKKFLFIEAENTLKLKLNLVLQADL